MGPNCTHKLSVHMSTNPLTEASTVGRKQRGGGGGEGREGSRGRGGERRGRFEE